MPETVEIADTPIHHEAWPAGGRYVATMPDGSEAELTYRERQDGTRVFDHTFVPPAFRTRGLAERMVERGVSEAREAGAKIVPLCPYVATLFRRHPEWADLRA